jgi:hypothetical protein
MRLICAGLATALLACAAAAQVPESRIPASVLEAIPSAGERGVPVPGNGADACAAAPEISGYGTWAFNLVGATTDGLAHPPCANAASDQIWRDRWWSWTALASGVVRVENCGQTTADTRIAVYSPAAPCSPTNEYVLACDDDSCTGFQSTLTFVAQAGQTYLIRLGIYGLAEPAAAGAGTFTISGVTQPDICPNDVVGCQTVDLTENAFTSTAAFRVADNFTVNASGAVTGLCWWGSYAGVAPIVDSFVITYWSNSIFDLPGVPLASFSQDLGGLAVQRSDTGNVDIAANTMFIFSAKHAPVPVADNGEYWVEVRNFFGGTWYWQGSQTGDNSLQDATPPSNWVGSTVRPDVAFCLHFQSGCAFDTNGDGVLNFADLNNIVSFFNTNCP